MAYTTQTTEGLVKFVRGTAAQYAGITKNENTLYFVYESADATTGKLYLGSKQIGDGSISSIKELISQTVSDGDLLVYDQASEDWIPTSLDDAVRLMSGATATEDGQSGLVPKPSAGDQEKFLRGDGTWATVTPGLSAVDGASIELNTDDELTLSGFEAATVGTIPRKTADGMEWFNPSSVTGVTYKKVDSLSDVTDAATIYLVPKTDGTTGNLFDEYMVIDGNAELISNPSSSVDLTGYATTSDVNSAISTLQGTIATTLNDYVTTTTFNSVVGNLSDLNRQAGDDSSLIDEINNINERLAWQEIVEDISE